MAENKVEEPTNEWWKVLKLNKNHDDVLDLFELERPFT